MNAEIEKEVMKCVQSLKDGGYIIFPSEIGWSIGCDAANDESISAILNSPDNLFPAILLSETGRLGKFTNAIPDSIWNLIEFTEKPLHLIIEQMINFPAPIYREMKDVAFRIVKDEFTISLTNKFGKNVFAATLLSSNHPAKSATILDKNCYVVNLRAGAKANPNSLVVIRLLKNEKFEIIRK